MKISDFDIQGARVVHWELDVSDPVGLRREDIIRLEFGPTARGPVALVVGWVDDAAAFCAYVSDPQDSSYRAWERSCAAVEEVPNLLRSGIEVAKRIVYMAAH